MGINGLLKGVSPLLIPENETDLDGKSSTSQPMYNIQQFKNKTIAIDASSWLYKACYSTSSRLVEAIEEDRIDHICEKILCKYMMKRCEELLTYAGIRRIYLVFDGKRCPLKAATNQEREAKRAANLKEARRLSALGMKEQANDKYKACVKVVPWMADSVAKAVAQRWKPRTGFIDTQPQVKCVFSPYEADAQLVKLCVDGICDAIVTEDSDVLVYTAACNASFPIIYKLDRNTGACDVISMDWLLKRCPSSKYLDTDGAFSMRRLLPSQLSSSKANSNKKAKKNSGPALLSHLEAITNREKRNTGSGVRMFVQACVLAGCDYAPRVPGVGLVTAFKMIKENMHRDPQSRFLHTLKSISNEKFGQETECSNRLCKDDFELILAKSECVFYYHRVLDRQGKVVPLFTPNDTSNEGANSSINEYLPSLDRFDDDSFIGDLNTVAHESGKISKQGIAHVRSKRKRATPIINPYSKSKVSTTNMFSKFANDSISTSSEKAKSPRPPSNVSSTSHVTSFRQKNNSSHDDESSLDDISDEELQPVFGNRSKKIKSTDETISAPKNVALSDDSSDDELDDVLQPQWKKSFITEERPENDSSPTLTTPSSSPKDNDFSQSFSARESGRSRYFFSKGSSTSKTKSADNCESNQVRLVTPTMADLRNKLESNEASKNHQPTKNISIDELSDDDDDCIIIESSTRSQNQKVQTPSRSKIFSSTFTRAQNEGTRGRMFAKLQKQKQSKKSKTGALGKSTKNAKTASIKGFFKYLPTSIE